MRITANYVCIALASLCAGGSARAAAPAAGPPPLFFVPSNVPGRDFWDDRHGLGAFQGHAGHDDLVAIKRLAAELEPKWRDRDANQYAYLMSVSASLLYSLGTDAETRTLARHYAQLALDKSDSLYLDTEFRLLELASAPNTGTFAGTGSERATMAARWLKALRRLDAVRDPDFDFADFPRQPEQPPETETNSDLKLDYERRTADWDAKDRKWMEQRHLVQLYTRYAPLVERRLIAMYTSAPAAPDELHRLLATSSLDSAARTRVESAVATGQQGNVTWWDEHGPQYSALIQLSPRVMYPEKGNPIGSVGGMETLGIDTRDGIPADIDYVMGFVGSGIDEAVRSLDTESWVELRRRLTPRWLNAWAALRKRIRPWRWQDAPMMYSTIPPPTEEMLAENEKKRVASRANMKLEDHAHVLQGMSEQAIVTMYSLPPYAPSELRDFLQKSGLNIDTRVKILGAVAVRTDPQ